MLLVFNFTTRPEVDVSKTTASVKSHGMRVVCKLKPHLHALRKRYDTPNFWHRADNFKARHSQFGSCKRIGPKCNVVPVPKILGVPRLPPGGSLGTGKRGTVPKNSFV